MPQPRIKFRTFQPSDYTLTLDFEYPPQEMMTFEERRFEMQNQLRARQSWGEYLSSWLDWTYTGIKFVITLGGSVATYGGE